jgi:hypothetical protein
LKAATKSGLLFSLTLYSVAPIFAVPAGMIRFWGQAHLQLFRLSETHRTEAKTGCGYYPPYHSKYNPIERCWGS